MFEKLKFTTGAGKKLDFSNVVTQIKRFMEEGETKIIVGSDSQRINKRRGFSFVTVICCLRPGKGGHYYYWKEYRKPHRKMKLQAELAWKMWKEAEDIRNTITELIDAGLDLDGVLTHHDLSVDGESGQHIKGIIGFMKAYGYKPEIKPEAFVASGIADKYSKS